MFFPFRLPQTQFIKREVRPPAVTFYVNIPLGKEKPARPMTGIFVPEGYQVQPQIDLIVYLQGYRYLYPSMSIDGYWSIHQKPFWPLRLGVNLSLKNVILVAPTLGPRSEGGSLIEPGGFDAYLDQVCLALMEHGPYRTARQQPMIGNIILACHSGGGYPMRQVVLTSQRYSSNIRECWGFDCLYDDDDLVATWADWAWFHPDSKLYIYYLSDTEDNSKQLQRQQLPNVFVERSPARGLKAHYWVPANHWRYRIQKTEFLVYRSN